MNIQEGRAEYRLRMEATNSAYQLLLLLRQFPCVQRGFPSRVRDVRRVVFIVPMIGGSQKYNYTTYTNASFIGSSASIHPSRIRPSISLGTKLYNMLILVCLLASWTRSCGKRSGKIV